MIANHLKGGSYVCAPLEYLTTLSPKHQLRRSRTFLLIYGGSADDSGRLGVYDILVKYLNVSVVWKAETFFKTWRPQRTYLPDRTTKNYGPRLVDETALRPVSF